jgi:hypothetical protein
MMESLATGRIAGNQEERDPITLAPFNPTCRQAQITALKLLALKADDVLFDLGSGDGQFLIQAATITECMLCVGIELNPVFVSRGIQAKDALPENIKRRVVLRQGDVLVQAGVSRASTPPSHGEGRYLQDSEIANFDQVTLLDDATAVFVYLLPKGMKKIKSLLDVVVNRRTQEQKKFRVVSYIFSIPGWEPTTVDRSTKADVPIYLYEFNP